jgi:hypothetical protein
MIYILLTDNISTPNIVQVAGVTYFPSPATYDRKFNWDKVISLDTLNRNLLVFDPETEMICLYMTVLFASSTQTSQETPLVACKVYLCFLQLIDRTAPLFPK